MDIRNELMEMTEHFNEIDSKFRQLWDSMLDTDDGVSGEVYYNLLSLGSVICPVFVSDASRHVDATDNRFYIKRSYC